MRGIIFDMNPPEPDLAGAAAAGFAAGSVPDVTVAASAVATAGVKRSAVLGTSSTPVRSVEVMVAAAVMPGRRLRSLLLTSSKVM